MGQKVNDGRMKTTEICITNAGQRWATRMSEDTLRLEFEFIERIFEQTGLLLLRSELDDDHFMAFLRGSLIPPLVHRIQRSLRQNRVAAFDLRRFHGPVGRDDRFQLDAAAKIQQAPHAGIFGSDAIQNFTVNFRCILRSNNG